jgi:hypothetical protein
VSVVAELLRPELSESVVAKLALYILLRLTQRGEHRVDDEKLVKMLFFAIYTKPGPDGRPVLRENPPRLSSEAEFRIYLHGPYIRVRKLVDAINESGRHLLGMRDIELIVVIDKKLMLAPIIREAVNDLAEALREQLKKRLERIYGQGYLDIVDEWVVGHLGSMSTEELEKLSLTVLHLETIGPPIKKAMVFNMNIDDYIELLRELDKIRRDYEAGELTPDYDVGSLEDLVEED